MARVGARDAGWVDTVHQWEIPARDLTRHEERRGRRFAYDGLIPYSTALVVVDLVTFFVETTTYARGIVEPVNQLARTVRRAGGSVAWVTPAVRSPSPWAIEFFGPAVAEAYAGSGEALWPGLDAWSGDLHLEKAAPSAFFPGRSRLDDVLRERDVDTVLVCGTVTNVCVEATARDAATLQYRTIVVGDACAGVDDESHAASLRTIHRSFGDVRRVAEVEALLLSSPAT